MDTEIKIEDECKRKNCIHWTLHIPFGLCKGTCTKNGIELKSIGNYFVCKNFEEKPNTVEKRQLFGHL